MAQNGWWAKNGTTLISLVAALAIVTVVAWLWWPAPKATAEAAPERDQEGWEVRYNATLALARRGSARTDLDVLAKMLDEPLQLRNFQSPVRKGEPFAGDEQEGRMVVLKTLEAVIVLHQKQPGLDLLHQKQPGLDLRAPDSPVKGALEKLTRSDNLTLREKAEHTLKELAR